jgi:hypothetical protein
MKLGCPKTPISEEKKTRASFNSINNLHTSRWQDTNATDWPSSERQHAAPPLDVKTAVAHVATLRILMRPHATSESRAYTAKPVNLGCKIDPSPRP